MKRFKEILTIIFAILFLVAIPAFITFSPFFLAVFFGDFIFLFLILFTWIPALLTVRFAEFVLGKII